MYSRTLYFQILIIFVFTSFAFAQDSDEIYVKNEYTLNDCVERALVNSPRIKAAEDVVQQAEDDIGIARSGFLPKLTAFASRRTIYGLAAQGRTDSDYDDQTTVTQGLQLTQTIFAGLTIFNNYQRAILAHQYAIAQFEDARARVELEVLALFLEMFRALEDVKIYESHLSSLNATLQAMNAMLARNLVTYGEVVNIEAEIADTKLRISEYSSLATQKSIELKGLMHYPFEKKVVFIPLDENFCFSLDMSLDEIREYSLLHRPSVRLARLAVAVVKKDEEMAMGAFAPRLSFTFAYQNHDVDYKNMGASIVGPYDLDYRKEYFSGVLSLEWDLFQGGRDYYALRKSRHEISRLNNNLLEQEVLTQTDVEKSYVSYKESKSREDLAKLYLASAEENFSLINARYEKKLSTQQELMLARSKLQNASSNLSKAEVDSKIALVNLYYVMGMPFTYNGM